MLSTGKRAVKIRPMTSDDIDSIMSLQWAQIPQKGLVSSQRGGWLDASFIAELEGRLVGFVLAQLIYVGRPMTGVGQLHLLVVQPEHQHRGIGTMLLAQLQSLCKDRAIAVMRAVVPQDGAQLRKYFEDVGFRPSRFINYDRPCD